MADHHPASFPRFGRGRGGGILINSLPNLSFSPIPMPSRDSKTISSFKDFFSSRKSNKTPRQKLGSNLNSSLRTFQYSSSQSYSQNKKICSNTTMPSPVPATSPSQDSTQSTLAPWCQVTKRKSSRSPPPQVSDPPQAKSSANSFAAFTDDEDESLLTDLSPVDSHSDDQGPQFPRSDHKKKTKKKKSLKKRRQSKSRGILPSDSSMESDDNIPPKQSAFDKLSPTQQKFLRDDESSITATNSVTQTQPHDIIPDPSQDLIDSDLEKPEPKLKNSDIRSFYSKPSSSSAPPSQIPLREHLLSKPPGDFDFAIIPPKALVDILYTSRNFSSSAYMTHLQNLSYKQIISLFHAHFHSLQESSAAPKLLISTHSYGFFDRTTLDWEITSLSHNEAMTLILGIKEFNKSLVFCDFDNLNSMHDLLKITRDKLQQTTSKFHVNLWNHSKTHSPVIDLTDEDNSHSTVDLTTPASQTSEDQSPTIQMEFTHTNKDGLLAAPTPTETEQQGMNVNMMMATPITPSPFRPPPKEAPSPVAPAVSVTQFSARFEISPSNATAINVPLVARQLFRIFKKADRTLRLLPWFQDSNSDLDTIDQEEDLPTSEDEVKHWVDNPHIRNNMLSFAMRIECVAKPKHIRDTFVPWMLKNKSFIKLDELDAQEIYGVGFIADLHPHYYNRAALKAFLKKKLQEMDTDIDINLYVRRVWNHHQGVKVISKAVVIEVDKKHRYTAANALINIDLSSNYRYAKFIPFNKSIIDDATLQNILISQNTYQHATKRRTIKGLTSIYDNNPTLDNKTESIRDWLLSIIDTQSESQQEFIFEHVETSVNGDTVLIYPSHYNSTVLDFVNHFEAHLRGKFADSNSLYTSVPFSTGTSQTDAIKEYGRQIAARFNNPQDGSPSPPPAVSPTKPRQLYYGAADSAPDTHFNHLMKPSQSAKKPATQKSKPKIVPQSPPPTQPVSQPPPSTPEPSVLERLAKLETSTAKQFQQISKSITTIDSRFEDLDKKRAQDKTVMITAVTTAVTQVMNQTLPQIIADQLKVATEPDGGEKL